MNRFVEISVPVVTMFSMLLACGKHVTAGPVTLRFEATINQTNVHGTIDHAAPISVGDKIYGSFQFQPRDVDPPSGIDQEFSKLYYTYDNVPQPYSLRMDLKGVPLMASEFEIHSVDNQPVIDAVPPATWDFLSVQCLDWEPSNELKERGFYPGYLSLQLTGRSLESSYQRFDGADIPSDIHVWKSFERRSFSLGFTSITSEGSVNAYGTFEITGFIPEPGSLTIAVVAAAFGWVAWPLRNRS